MRSIRRRLILGIVATTALMFIGAGVVIYVLTRASLLNEFDAATRAKADAVATTVEYEKTGFRLEDSGDGRFADFSRKKHPEYFQMWAPDGSTLARSKSLGNADLARADETPMTLPDGRVGRQVLMSFMARIEDDIPNHPPLNLTIAVARQTHELDEQLHRLALLLVLVCGVSTVIVWVLTTLVIRRGLAPVNTLAGNLSSIDEQNLSAKLSLSDAPDELSPIVNRLNDLLSRLHGAFEREKAFTADAAHELRTPLAGLEAALGVCAKKPRAPEAYAAVVNDCLAVVRGMHGMIDNLLLLARADAQQVQLTREPVCVAELVEDTAAQFSKKAAERSLNVWLDVDPHLLVQTDRERLLHVMKNLFDNAVNYADSGGAIRVSTASGNPHVKIRIANTGSNICADDAAHVFDRFWRGDPARSDVGTHCGVGLSVCQKMIHALGGTICATSSVGGEFVVEISLPV